MILKRYAVVRNPEPEGGVVEDQLVNRSRSLL
jgi:hypothetical protein